MAYELVRYSLTSSTNWFNSLEPSQREFVQVVFRGLLMNKEKKK